MFILNTQAFNSQEISKTQELDSLLISNLNTVYENPDKSIDFGLSVYNESINSNTTRARALILVSLAYTSKRNYQKALEYMILADGFSSKLKDKKLQVEILYRTGVLYQQLKFYDKAIEYLEKGEQLILDSPELDLSKQLSKIYIIKGFIFKDNFNCDIALEFFERGINEIKRYDDDSINGNLSIIYYNQGNCYIIMSEYEEAKKSFEESISYAKLGNANSLLAFAKKGLAEVYFIENNHELAIDLLLKALEQSKNVGDLVLNSGIYYGLFNNYLALNKWDNYKKYYNLYLNTILQIKISERNSISDSIDENTRTLNANINKVVNKHKTKIKSISLLIIIILISVFFVERNNKKNIKILQEKIESINIQKENS